MSRIMKVVVALLAIAAIAAPAMADVKVNGYYRLQGTMENFETAKGADKTSNFVDQRLRLKVSNQLNDAINVVWYGEYDSPFGVTGGKTVAGAGGKLSADGVGIETKNAYVDFKVPNSSWSVRTGIQGYGFGAYESFVTNDDMAGISAMGNLGMAHLSGGWFKWDEGDVASADDIDFYMLNADFAASEQLKFGLTVGLVANNSSTLANKSTLAKTDDYYYGANASFVQDNLGFAGSLLYRDAKDQDGSSADGETYMVNLYAKVGLSSGKLKVHGVYIPADDSSTGTNRFGANNAAFEFNGDNLMIFGTDVYYNNGTQGGLAAYAAYAGYGLMGLTVSGDYKLPEASYLKYGAGYFMVADDEPKSASKVDGSELGIEVAAQIGKVFVEKYDLSVRGAYGFMGDYYGSDAEDTYKAVAMLNVSF